MTEHVQDGKSDLLSTPQTYFHLGQWTTFP